MKQNSVKFTLKKLKSMLDDGTLTWDTSIQRGTGAWKPNQKGELIHSILSDYYIPSLCFLRTLVHDETKNKDVSYYSVLDGKQRLSVIFSFMNDEYKLHKSIPNITLEDGTDYPLAGKKFSDLDSELSNKIKNFTFEITSLEECTETEVEQLFFRLNNGTSLTKVQKSRATMGGDVAGFVNKLLNYSFFNVCNLTTLQKNREDNLTALLQGMMIIDDSYDWADLGAKEVSKYSIYLKDNLTIPTQYKIAWTLAFLSDVFQEKDVFLKRINIPIIIRCGYEATKYANMDREVFLTWYEEFVKDDSKYQEEYKKFCGEGSVSKEKVNGRIKVALDSMEKILKLSENELNDTDMEYLENSAKAEGRKFIVINN